MMLIIQKYTRSLNSTNLRDDETHHNTDVLAAVALSGLLGSKLFRVKYNSDATSFNVLLEDWRVIVKHKAASRNWPIDVSPSKIARLSLEYYLNDVCVICCGRGHLPYENIHNVLEDEPCPVCNGTAKKPIEAKHNLIKYIADMVESLEAMTIHAGDEAIRRMAKEIDL